MKNATMRRWLGAMAAGLVCAALPAGAATATWQLAATNSAWSGAGNWGGTAPVNGDDLVFISAAGNLANQPSNNDLAGLALRSLTFANNTFSNALFLGGNAITLDATTYGATTTLTNANTTAGRNVTISNNISVVGSQTWGIVGNVNAITVLRGNLTSAAGTVLTLGSGNDSSGGALPALRLSGSNSGFLGRWSLGSSTQGILLMNPSAMIGGNIDISSSNVNVWIDGSAGTYTFGIGTNAGAVNFRNAGSGGLAVTGGAAVWDPGNGGHYAWTVGGNNEIRLNGRDSTSSNSLLSIGNSSSSLVLTGGSKTISNGNSPNGQVTEMRFALSDDGTARGLTTSANLLILTRNAGGGGGTPSLAGTNTISGGALAVSGMDQLFNGNLNLSGGVLVLNGVSWASFAADRASGYGTGANQWRITGGGGGFAARGTAVTIDTNGTTSAAFSRSFTLGSSALWTNGALYADQAVPITQDIAFSNVAVTIIARGASAESASAWTMNSPVHELSGLLSGGGASGVLNLQGGGTTAGGTVRIANTNNSYAGTVNVGGGGGAVYVFSGNGAFGNSANAVNIVSGSQGTGGLLLLENAGSGTQVFARAIGAALGSDASGGDSGFGSWQGTVRYDGTLSITGSAANTRQMPIHVQAGTLSFGAGATFVNNHSTAGTFTYHKNGPGELDLRGLSYGGSKTDRKWVLNEGALTCSSAAQLASGAVSLSDLFGGQDATTRRINIRDADVGITNPVSGTFSMNVTLDVESGRTLTMDVGTSNLISREIGPDTTGFSWGLTKTGAGAWVYRNTATSPSARGRFDGYIKVDQGTFDVTGNMGRGGLWLSGGTLLSGSYSLFVGTTQNNRFQVDSDGGKIGISANATGDVARAIAFDGTNNIWNLGGAGTVTLAARDNYNLIWSTNNFPDIGLGETLKIERDGSGTGVVQINDTAWSVAGTLAGSGALKLGASGTGTGTVSGTLSPGSSPGTLTVQGNLTLANGAAYAWEVGGTNSYDRVAVVGTLTFGSTATLNVLQFGGFVPGGEDYVLMTYTGAVDPTNPAWTINYPTGWTSDGVVVDGANDRVLLTNVIPEPGSLSVYGLLAAGFFLRRRMRR